MIRRHPLAKLLLVLLCCVALGCGGNTVRVSGTATFNGQSIPKGKIYFVPDTSKGNSGPTGYADIRNGSFDTSSTGGQGACSGAVIARIEGFTDTTPDGDVTTKALFYPYSVAVDLPKKSSTQKFDIPASAADKPQEPVGGPVIIP